MMPTLHYVVRFCGDIPLEHAILSNGVNPAAIILQLLLDAGASWSSIDKPSFSAAASFWAQKGYGLNIVFSRQKPVRDHIMQVLGAVGGWLIERADGTLSLRAPDPDVAPSATLGEGDFLEGSFSFKRAAWELLSEEGVLVERSATNADYSPVGLLSAPWAQYGTLAEAYPASTLAVDDTQGLLYRPYKEDPAFGPVSRTDLFGARRMALVGDELMLFQTVVLEGSETTRLSGVVRGYMNTPVQAHASGAAIWVFRNPGEGNTVQGLPIGTHNIKLRPVSGDEVLGADRVDRLPLAVTGKAMVPWPVAGLRAVRTGDSVAVSWSPVDVAFGGAGTRTENENEPVPAGFSGDFVLTAAGTEHVVNGTSITLTRSGRFALSVTARQLGYVSPAAYVTVESQDGEYVA